MLKYFIISEWSNWNIVKVLLLNLKSLVGKYGIKEFYFKSCWGFILI